MLKSRNEVEHCHKQFESPSARVTGWERSVGNYSSFITSLKFLEEIARELAEVT